MIRHQWLLIVAIAAALVGMHHLVAEHRGHAGRSTHALMTMAAGLDWSLTSPTLTEYSPAGPLAAKPVEASVASRAVLASHPCCGDSWAMVGHCCLVVLTIIIALTAAVLFATAWRRPCGPGHLLAGVGGVAARAPLTGSVQFTQLCVRSSFLSDRYS